jgi:hypothetical protein
MIAALPNVVSGPRMNRAFLARAVRYLATECGDPPDPGYWHWWQTTPTRSRRPSLQGPASSTLDNDPIVLAHARALLTGTPEGSVAYLHAHLRQPDKIRGATARTLDLSQPVALMMLMVVDRLLNACPRAATWPCRTRRATSWQKASPRCSRDSTSASARGSP